MIAGHRVVQSTIDSIDGKKRSLARISQVEQLFSFRRTEVDKTFTVSIASFKIIFPLLPKPKRENMRIWKDVN